MPVYDYQCPECAHQFKARHGFDDSPPPCPECEHAEVTRLILQVPKVLKGALAHAGDGKSASQEQLRDKWREETPKLRKQLADKAGEDAAASVPTLNVDYDD